MGRAEPKSPSSFVLDVADEQVEVITTSSLPSDFFDAVWAALDAPPRPNAALARKAKAQRRVAQR